MTCGVVLQCLLHKMVDIYTQIYTHTYTYSYIHTYIYHMWGDVAVPVEQGDLFTYTRIYMYVYIYT